MKKSDRVALVILSDRQCKRCCFLSEKICGLLYMYCRLVYVVLLSSDVLKKIQTEKARLQRLTQM